MRDIKPELTSELIQLSEWMSHYRNDETYFCLEAMLPVPLKAKYKKAFQLSIKNLSSKTKSAI